MRKVIFLVLTMILIFTINYSSYADVSDYNSYAYINVNKGKLLREYSDYEINSIIDEKITKRKFSGWDTYYLTYNAKVNFISDTIFSVYNDGTTSVDYTINVTSETTTKTSISSTGSISYSLKGDVKKFKHGLDTSLKIECSYQKTELVKNQENLVLHVDPNTICIVYIEGEGLLTNGVAKRYVCFATNERGGFEYFTITNAYVRIEKIKL